MTFFEIKDTLHRRLIDIVTPDNITEIDITHSAEEVTLWVAVGPDCDRYLLLEKMYRALNDMGKVSIKVAETRTFPNDTLLCYKDGAWYD